tara:strand:- start:845 stop:2443 length:1599 start_codon:yes stop_codon:yes gene_type:complete
MVVSDTGLITWTATEGVLTSGLFVITVFDGEFSVNQEFEILVESVNDSPVIISSAPTSVYLGDEYFYSLTIEDPDNNEFTISLDGEPDGMILFEGGSIAWTPESVGEYGPILITVSDGELSFTQTFTLIVEYNYTVANYGFSQGNNLISFYSIPPEGDGVDFVFGSLGSNLSYIFGQNSLATQIDDQWVGSLDTVEPDKGYWLNLEQSTPFTVYGLPTGSDVTYEINSGNNLISYAYDVAQNIEDALPEDIQDKVYAIFGQNLSALNINGMWIGSLTTFEPGKGYWLRALEPFTFEYNQPSGASFARQNIIAEVPSPYSYVQSRLQSFYYIEEIAFNECENCSQNVIEEGDWIIAYNNDVVVGARQWNGELINGKLYIDVPVMGYDMYDDSTVEYCQAGDIPSFKLLKKTTNELLDLSSSDIEEYTPDQIQIVAKLSHNVLPVTVNLFAPYPNPFNPTTSIEYDVPQGGMNINLSIYDIRGRLVEELVDGFHQGRIEPYKVLWNAEYLSSGIYFVRLKTDVSNHVQKITLIK